MARAPGLLRESRAELAKPPRIRNADCLRFCQGGLKQGEGRKPPTYSKNAWNLFAAHLFSPLCPPEGSNRRQVRFLLAGKPIGPLPECHVPKALQQQFRDKPSVSRAPARQDKTMFQLTLGREFFVVFGVIGIAAAVWAAWVIETPGLLPL
jgi:hypothetical protein